MTSASSPRRVATGVVALVLTVLAYGLYTRTDWATWVWPWNDGRLTYVFLASIAAAVAAPLFWLVIVDEPGAITGLAVDGAVIGAGLTLAFLAMAVSRGEPRLLLYSFGVAIAATASGWVYFRTRDDVTQSEIPLPPAARIAFIVFIAVLIPAGIGMITRRNGLFPWEIPSATSTIIGTFFLGATTYFVYALVKDRWVHGAALLVGFLAYDAVLFWPYFDDFLHRDERTRLAAYGPIPVKVDGANLAFYLAVLVFSALIAVYYLAFDPQTRFWAASRDESRN